MLRNIGIPIYQDGNMQPHLTITPTLILPHRGGGGLGDFTPLLVPAPHDPDLSGGAAGC